MVRDAKVHLVVQGGTFGRLVWAPGSDAVAYNDFGSLSADVERAMVARKLKSSRV